MPRTTSSPRPSPVRTASSRPPGSAAAAAAEDALLRGCFDAAASAGLDALRAGGGPVAARGAAVAVQALFELGR
jgi:hypothetical protein